VGGLGGGGGGGFAGLFSLTSYSSELLVLGGRGVCLPPGFCYGCVCVDLAHLVVYGIACVYIWYLLFVL